MVEYDPSRTSDRQVISGVVGTVTATLFGPVPPQYSLEILEENFANYGSLAASAYLLQFATLQTYSPYGTLAGTIVEVVQIPGLNTVVIGSGQGVVAKVEPGNYLEGLVMTTGSIGVKVIARLAPGRGI